MPTIDSVTRRRAPAAAPSRCRRSVTSVKKGTATLREVPGAFETSTTTSTPSRARATSRSRPRSVPSARLRDTVSCPAARAAPSTCRPTVPVPPATAILTPDAPDGAANYRCWARPAPPGSPATRQRVGPLGDRRHGGLAGEHLVQQDPVDLGVPVGTGVP